MKKLFFIILIAPFVISSCKKANDDQVPTITISSPANGSQANVTDTLHVTIHCADNVSLQNLNVRLVTTDMIPVLPTVSVPMSGKTYDATFNYVISNYRITTGNYYLSVDATDGNDNLGRSYSNLFITGIPRQLKGFFAATIPSAGTVDVYKCDTSWLPSVFNSNTSDFTDLAVSNYWQQVYVSGSYSGPLQGISIDGSTTGFSLPPIVGATPYWGMMSVKDARFWVCCQSLHQFKSFDQAGSSSFIGTADNGFYASMVLQDANRIFTEQKDIASSNMRMVVYSSAGGGLQETPVTADAIGMFERDADNVYVVGNTSGQGHLLIYDFTTNGFWEPIALPAGTTTSATQIDSNTLLIGMSNGSVYKFTYNPVGLLTWTSGINPTQLRYDDVNAEVYSAEGSNVKVYNLNPFSLQHTIPIPNPISDLELWYNL